jgi:hypothetical protein
MQELFCGLPQVEQQFVRKEECSHANSKQWQKIFEVVEQLWHSKLLECRQLVRVSSDCITSDNVIMNVSLMHQNKHFS